MQKCATLIFILLFNFILSQESGRASWYGGKQHHLHKTANGQTFDENKLTSASNTHKFGTILKVTNTANDKSVLVTVNDRGGFTKYNRLLDLSKAAFESIADLNKGIITVLVEVVQ